MPEPLPLPTDNAILVPAPPSEKSTVPDPVNAPMASIALATPYTRKYVLAPFKLTADVEFTEEVVLACSQKLP